MRTVLLLLLAAACSSTPPPLELDAPPVVLTPIRYSPVVDDRGRFREIFSAVREARGQGDPEDPTCEALLHRMAHETGATGAAVHLGAPRMKLRVLIVPGLVGDSLDAWVLPFKDSVPALRELGWTIDYLSVSGRASCEYNARTIRDAFAKIELGPDEKLLLVGYSKGAPDILEALVRHEGVRKKTTAVLSVCGAVGGSPVANDTQGFMRSMFQSAPIGGDKGDGAALESLERGTRQEWLNRNTLPESVKYFSVGAFAARDRISSVFKSSYDTCAAIDPRNDSQILFFDQVIPAGWLLGYAHGDHFAVSLPMDTNMPTTAALFVTQNEYPRAVLLEACLRHVEERLLLR
ncbi:MAG: esterase/lipase family protein [Planctomycetota bacterium]